MDRAGAEGAEVRNGKGVRIALAISVALNLLVIGLVAGAVLRDGGPRGRMGNDLALGPFTEALAPADRAALRQEFMQRMPEMRDARRQMRADFKGLLLALRAEPFDVAAVRGLIAGQSERMAGRLAVGQDLLVGRIEAMTPEARAAFADRLEEGLRRGPERRGAGG
ncbi:hypothetical protein HYN69_04925 [Gemmobacter aquarius]|uniref:Heavy-metal resistance n=1 Tax=Paragemmobacter aquarius TaxID=2169400 RepID=A0A2S0UJG5_9RHOB|nr:hypothetical protein HYN69_04925 [Gemmobacter aquarius]